MERIVAIQRLGGQWIRELADADKGGFVCSPAGLWLALAAVASGAREETAAELCALLGVADREAAPVVTAVARDLARTEALAVATRVWTRVPVLPAYREALPDIPVGAMDPAEIDSWVRRATGGLIERLPLRITDATLLALVNVLALKAHWETPFEGRFTRDVPFTDTAGTSRPVATMRGPVAQQDAWTADGAYVVELRCRTEPGGGAPARVRFVLGEPGAGAARVLPSAWAPRPSGTPLDADEVSVGIPRFTLRTTVQVTEQLPALGVRIATSGAADFSGISPVPLALSTVVQETVVKIAEKGVEAAAVTVVPTRAGSAPRPRQVRHIAFDRPFGVVVLDGVSDVPLFTGWQADMPVHEG
ncbi:serpin family protein [Streptomyces sp. NPDC057136]|uniref:serpin family protein n=1 Tax=Streptomyces sp. NPDC057136 TaxID=3346029 RepID=UPI0036431BF2